MLHAISVLDNVHQPLKMETHSKPHATRLCPHTQSEQSGRGPMRQMGYGYLWANGKDGKWGR